MRLDLLLSRADTDQITAIGLKYLTALWTGEYDGEWLALKITSRRTNRSAGTGQHEHAYVVARSVTAQMLDRPNHDLTGEGVELTESVQPQPKGTALQADVQVTRHRRHRLIQDVLTSGELGGLTV